MTFRSAVHCFLRSAGGHPGISAAAVVPCRPAYCVLLSDGEGTPLSLRRRWRPALAVSACAVALTAGLAACGSPASADDTLTVGVTGDTLGLAPLGGGCGPAIYCYPDYDSLIYETAAGQFEPDLATSWQFTDATHQTLLVNLRQGVYFTDGSELTGAAAAASINAFRSAPGPLAGNAYPIDSVTADGKYAVKIHYSTASTLDHALSQLTPQNSIGAIVGPAGVKNPASLNTTSDGIGAYTLDAAQTTAGSHYTYTANPRYFNKAAVRYRTVVMMPMADQSSRLSAVQSGQIDWAQGLTATQAESAQSSGLQVSTGSLGRSPQGVTMLVLANRASGPLTSLDVRQAIQYAVPRQQVTKVVYGEGATATSSITAQGDEGYAPAIPACTPTT